MMDALLANVRFAFHGLLTPQRPRHHASTVDGVRAGASAP